MMKVVPFTHHQLLKCPTLSGMANIRGDHAMARTVAAVTRKRLGWVQKTSQAGPNEDPPMDKKQKRIADQ